jgi:hypothetical protein
MKYRAHYGNGLVREFYAVHVYQANKKAAVIAKSNGWRLISVGLI